MAGERCPVWRMMAWASAPARKASVTKPDRSECPPMSWVWAGVNPAWSARRLIISLTASPDIARAPMAPVLCTAGNNTRPGSTGSESRAVRHTCSTASPSPSPSAGRCDGGLSAEHAHHCAAAAAVGGGVPRGQHLPPPHVRARRARGGVAAERQGLHLPLPFLVGLRGPQPHMQPIGLVQLHVGEGRGRRARSGGWRRRTPSTTPPCPAEPPPPPATRRRSASMDVIRVRMSSNNKGARRTGGVARMRRIPDSARRTTSDPTRGVESGGGVELVDRGHPPRQRRRGVPPPPHPGHLRRRLRHIRRHHQGIRRQHREPPLPRPGGEPRPIRPVRRLRIHRRRRIHHREDIRQGPLRQDRRPGHLRCGDSPAVDRLGQVGGGGLRQPSKGTLDSPRTAGTCGAAAEPSAGISATGSPSADVSSRVAGLSPAAGSAVTTSVPWASSSGARASTSSDAAAAARSEWAITSGPGPAPCARRCRAGRGPGTRPAQTDPGPVGRPAT